MAVHKMYPFSRILRTYFSVGLLVFLMACNPQGEEKIISKESLSPAAKYMLDIALTAELGTNGSQRIKKWSTEMRVFISDTVGTELKEEFKLIQSEINAISEDFRMVQVEERNAANFIIFASNGETFAQYEPNARPFI